MRLFAPALDYDGTIAAKDQLDPQVRDAIAAARRRNIAVILVTGRILDELRRVAGDLHFVDAAGVVGVMSGGTVTMPRAATIAVRPARPGPGSAP